jgi:uncharacterized protein YbdZ (MbtH family)
METSREVDKVSEQKIEQFWRDATADDVARVVRGEKIAMRYRESEDDKWSTEKLFLAGYDASDTDGCHWLSNKGDMLSFCQVYDPPEWYINKPEPGEGWRLLEKFPRESLRDGDEWFETTPIDAGWKLSHNAVQANTIWYRRRIANSPTSSDSSRSRDTIPTGWRVLGKDEERLASDAYWSLGCKEWIVIGDGRVEYANDLPRWHAIRQVEYYVDCVLVSGVRYKMPDGKEILVAEKGFEVL